MAVDGINSVNMNQRAEATDSNQARTSSSRFSFRNICNSCRLPETIVGIGGGVAVVGAGLAVAGALTVAVPLLLPVGLGLVVAGLGVAVVGGVMAAIRHYRSASNSDTQRQGADLELAPNQGPVSNPEVMSDPAQDLDEDPPAPVSAPVSAPAPAPAPPTAPAPAPPNQGPPQLLGSLSDRDKILASNLIKIHSVSQMTLPVPLDYKEAYYKDVKNLIDYLHSDEIEYIEMEKHLNFIYNDLLGLKVVLVRNFTIRDNGDYEQRKELKEYNKLMNMVIKIQGELKQLTFDGLTIEKVVLFCIDAINQENK